MKSEALLQEEKKNKNLLAIAIILGGLFLGSLFVDFVQLVSGEGFSVWATKNYNVLETAGKTWVGYGDPRVELQVITDSKCPTCDPNEALVWLRRVIPTIEVTKVDVADERGGALAERLGVVTVPAFLFSKSVTETNFYTQASSLFQQREGRYLFDMSKIGLPAGRYLKLPTVGEEDIVMGNPEAAVTITVFSDFECSFCQAFHRTLRQVANQYGERVRVVYKHLPLAGHTRAVAAAVAAECANEQGKFEAYADHLFLKQGEWSKTGNDQKFRDYAWWLKLDYRQFTDCLKENTYQEKIERNQKEAAELFISTTPATFVNDTFVDGAVTGEELQGVIEQELAN